eukprot:CAMPEP_0119401060 /NCGR_PEP_ID=MMETSP1334-20130426/142178_1 /TAXON_ID=127549 /ORGANISM="Calcidiscus leptoporus, Strain RCC1130" /LENGTH=180 /DNA_ID=CAMNT_0007424969 /DNA_START=272 /DNA_END=815 /DNA_ORIENTATION=-
MHVNVIDQVGNNKVCALSESCFSVACLQDQCPKPFHLNDNLALLDLSSLTSTGKSLYVLRSDNLASLDLTSLTSTGGLYVFSNDNRCIVVVNEISVDGVVQVQDNKVCALSESCLSVACLQDLCPKPSAAVITGDPTTSAAPLASASFAAPLASASFAAPLASASFAAPLAPLASRRRMS